jgi:hypothetical protein
MGTLSCAGDQVALFDGAVWACKTAVLVRSVGMTTNTALETAGDVGRFSSVAIGLDGNPVISYQDQSNFHLELYVCAEPACSSGANHTLETTGDVGSYSSVAIGSDANPVISHRDASNGDLELYVCANAACSSGTNHTLETTDNVGSYSSVAIGSDGNPIIAHADYTNGDLEFVTAYFMVTGIAYQ